MTVVNTVYFIAFLCCFESYETHHKFTCWNMGVVYFFFFNFYFFIFNIFIYFNISFLDLFFLFIYF